MLLAACGSDDPSPTSRIFQAPPWAGSERLTYDLLDEGNRLEGVCVFETEPGDAVLTLRNLCEDADGEGHRDDRVVEVDPQTLAPLHSERVLTNMDSGKRTTFTGDYGASAVLGYERVDIATGTVEEVRTTERELPEPDEESPDPGVYDDESLYWLVRGIPLEEGWSGAYHNVNAGIVQIFVANVDVEGTERIRVPAGEFEAWRIRIRTSSISQRVWVDVESPHRVVRAEIERSRYVLRTVE